MMTKTTTTKMRKCMKFECNRVMSCCVVCYLHWVVDYWIPFVLFIPLNHLHIIRIPYICIFLSLCMLHTKYECLVSRVFITAQNYFVKRIQLTKSARVQKKRKAKTKIQCDRPHCDYDGSHHHRHFIHSTFKYVSFAWEYCIAFSILFFIGFVTIGFTFARGKMMWLRNRPRFTRVSHDREKSTVAHLRFCLFSFFFSSCNGN